MIAPLETNPPYAMACPEAQDRKQAIAWDAGLACRFDVSP
jgi:hypothetical protein